MSSNVRGHRPKTQHKVTVEECVYSKSGAANPPPQPDATQEMCRAGTHSIFSLNRDKMVCIPPFPILINISQSKLYVKYSTHFTHT
jgi:hypothetical protein